MVITIQNPDMQYVRYSGESGIQVCGIRMDTVFLIYFLFRSCWIFFGFGLLESVLLARVKYLFHDRRPTAGLPVSLSLFLLVYQFTKKITNLKNGINKRFLSEILFRFIWQQTLHFHSINKTDLQPVSRPVVQVPIFLGVGSMAKI